MRLSELIAFARDLPTSPDDTDRTDSDDLPEDVDAPQFQRLPLPPWVTEISSLRDTGDLVVVAEPGFSASALPADLQRPNPIIDTLAYYLPYHSHTRNWGIYIREAGILVVASILKGSEITSDDTALLLQARSLLFEHELFHFHSELACTRGEVVSHNALYSGYFSNPAAAGHEEALANAAAFRTLRRSDTAIQERVSSWMQHQGPGYRDFDRWLGRTDFSAGCRQASYYMIKRVAGPGISRPGPSEFLFDAMRRFKPPVYLVLDTSSTLKPFPKAYGMRVLVHTRDHEPPHVHIEIPPGLPRTRCKWPGLHALKGDPVLSAAEMKSLTTYLADYGPDIDARVRAVYPRADPWSPPST